MAVPQYVVFNPLNQVTNSMGGGSGIIDARISPIGVITFGFLWGGFDPWVPCGGTTTSWAMCTPNVTTSWTGCG